MLSRLTPFIVCAAAFVSLAACSGATPLSSAGYENEFTSSSSQPDQKPYVKLSSKQSADEVAQIFDQFSVPDANGETADYRLASMDVIDVSVFGAPDLSRQAQVSASGFITLPLIKDVKAAGKTVDQLQADIAKRLSKDFMQSPQVFVSVKEYNSQRVTVDGAVRNPGVFPLKGETTLVQVLALAGGLNEMASTGGVYVLRKSDGKKMAARFDLKEIRSGQKPDPAMMAGDIVMVDESGGKVMFRELQRATSFSGIFGMLLL